MLCCIVIFAVFYIFVYKKGNCAKHYPDSYAKKFAAYPVTKVMTFSARPFDITFLMVLYLSATEN